VCPSSSKTRQTFRHPSRCACEVGDAHSG
jgi:hypothetical protein